MNTTALCKPSRDGGLAVRVLAVRGELALLRASTVRSLRRTAGVLTLALAALPAAGAPTPAQDTNALPAGPSSVLVSNRSQTIFSAPYPFPNLQLAQAFSTGTNPGGYALESIELVVADTPIMPSMVVVEIRASTGPLDARVPGATLHVLTNPTRFSLGPNTFRAPSGATLASATTYFVVVRYEGPAMDFRLIQTRAAAEDPAGDPEWSIANGVLYNIVGWSRGLYPLSVTFDGRAAPASINTPPTIISPATFEVDESRTRVGTVTATDNEDPVFYAITGGEHASRFEIDEMTGVLRLKADPGHSKPVGASGPAPAGGNEYTVTITATGGRGSRAMTDRQTLLVTMVEADESPQPPQAATQTRLGSMGLGLLGLLVLVALGHLALPPVLAMWGPIAGVTHSLVSRRGSAGSERGAHGTANHSGLRP